MEQALAIREEDIPKLLNENVLKVISDDKLIGFEKAHLIAQATIKLRELLTAKYMEPINALQGNRLGFKTDKDGKGGYPVEVVRDCLIEAVLTGVQPFGNQFNIIAGNCYITKEGMGHLLSKMHGLDYDIVPTLPRINGDRTSAAIVMKITWSYRGTKGEKEIDFPIRMNVAMGTDAVIGKATRKARAWLFSKLTGVEIGEGDVQDVDHTVVKDPPADKKTIESKRVFTHIEQSTTLDMLEKVYQHLQDEHLDAYTVKKDQLTAKK